MDLTRNLQNVAIFKIKYKKHLKKNLYTVFLKNFLRKKIRLQKMFFNGHTNHIKMNSQNELEIHIMPRNAKRNVLIAKKKKRK